ncbi:MAG TPA: GntR family transcriptional regulator [Bacillota bacterium]|nr:GntR family transcriptional regulator [Bacillota bacterium]HPZ21909.1 GntR family transcriptional regulator [Bacillota bacterium]HQD19647.1 GntR family transcriptional regulator [Bacillota bacterium]
MLINTEDQRPIFIQIAEGIEDAILTGAYPEESQIPSTTEISIRYNINPATALKGVNILVDSGIIYKKRGVGMFVKAGAKEKLQQKRRNQFFENYIVKLIAEAERLGISPREIIMMIERGYQR